MVEASAEDPASERFFGGPSSAPTRDHKAGLRRSEESPQSKSGTESNTEMQTAIRESPLGGGTDWREIVVFHIGVAVWIGVWVRTKVSLAPGARPWRADRL